MDVELNDNVGEYFKPVMDVKYVIGEGLKRKEVKEFSQLEALAKLYYTNESRLVQGQSPYIRIDIDNNGIMYAEITKEFIELAKSVEGCFNPAKVDLKPLSTKVKLNRAKDIADENYLDENIDEKLTHDMYEKVTAYAGVTPVSSEDSAFIQRYQMIFLPSDKILEDKELLVDRKGTLIDAQTAEPVVKKLEFRLFSN